MIRDAVRRFDETEYQAALHRMTDWAQPPLPDPKPSVDGEKPVIADVVQRVEYVARASLHVAFDKAWLADEQDVEDYLAAIRETLLAAVRAGKRVQL